LEILVLLKLNSSSCCGT